MAKTSTFTFTGMNAVGDDTYFIRLTDNPEYFIHFESENAYNRIYRVNKGIIGACCFHKVQGENFIAFSKWDNLEMVPAQKLIQDSSKN